MKRKDCNTELFIRRRQPLCHFKKAMENRKITVGILGGSISEPINVPWEQQRWPDKLTNWLAASFPEVIVNVENAAKGASGSESALFRVERDIISKNCDIVFVEYAVNDKDMPAYERALCREGLLRKLLCAPNRNYDVVVVYTYYGGMLSDMLSGNLYEGIADFEKLCEHYHISSVHMGEYALSQLQAGYVRYEEWLPDTVHAGDVGSRIYAEAVKNLLEKELQNTDTRQLEIPQPMLRDNWQGAYRLDMDEIQRLGPWKCNRTYRIPTVERILQTASLGAALEFCFHGRGLELFVRVNQFAAGYRVRVDDGKWIDLSGPRPDWCKKTPDWIRSDMLTGYEPGMHYVRLETFMANGATGTNFELCDVGIIP